MFDALAGLGLMSGLGIVYYVLSRGDLLGLLWNPDAALLVFGGTAAAGLISCSSQVLKSLPSVLRRTFIRGSAGDEGELGTQLLRLLRGYEKNGNIFIAENAGSFRHPLLSRGIELLVTGFSREKTIEVLGREQEAVQLKLSQAAAFFENLSGYAPVFGLLGTLIGIVQVLKNLSEPGSMGASMAVAITTTLYGILVSNLLLSPIAAKMNGLKERDAYTLSLVCNCIRALGRPGAAALLGKRLEKIY